MDKQVQSKSIKEKDDIYLSTRVEDIMEICKYFKKYEPEANAGVFMKHILNGIATRHTLLFVYHQNNEFKGGVVCSYISPTILFIDFAYIDQHIKNLSKKFLVAILKLAKELEVKELQTKATQHQKGAEKKFGFKEKYRILSREVN